MGKVAHCHHWWGMTISLRDVNQLAECEIKRKMKRWMIWLLSLAKGILFFFSMSVKLETASYMCIINWTVMLFYKHLCSFWERYSCMHASILVQLSSFVHHFLFSFFFFLFIGIFFSSLSITEKEKKASYYCCCLFSLSLSLSLSRKYFLLLYIHIYQSEEVRVVTRRFFFLLILAKFSPDITIILILLFAFAYAYVQE
jgi:hypothetical protein